MPEISSPLGRKTYGAPPAQNFVVEDASAAPAPQMPQPINHGALLEQRKQVLEEQKKVSHSARERIDMLVGLTKLRTTVVINGVSFGLRSLSAKEQKDALVMGSKKDTNAEALFEYRTVTLALALETIDGTPTSVMLGTENFDQIVDIVSSWDESMVAFLTEKYQEMVENGKVKFGFKPEEVSKVVEDLKK